jgi:hypothetical protein
MRFFLPFLAFLLTFQSLTAQNPGNPGLLEEMPVKPPPPGKPAPPGKAYNAYGFLISEKQAYWSKRGSHYTDKYYQDGKSGMKAQDGTVLIPAEYDDLHFQYCGFMVASKEGKFGVINEANQTVIPFSYKRLELLYKPQAFQVPQGVPLEDLRLLATLENGHAGLINGKGEVIFPFRENRYVEVVYYYPAVRTTQGYVTSDPPVYQKAMAQTALIFRQPQEIGVVAMDGQIVLPFQYATMDVYYGAPDILAKHPGWLQVGDADGKVGIFDLSRRQWMIEPKFQDGINPIYTLNPGEKPFGSLLFATRAETDPDEHGVTYIRAGVIDSTGRTMLPFEYDGFGLSFLHQGKFHIWAQKMGKWGVVDMVNRVVTPFEHPKVVQQFKMDRGPYFSLKDPTDQYFGLLSLEGKMAIPFKYKWLGDHNGRVVIFVNEGMKCGLVNDQGREVLPGIYTDIQLLRHGFFYINAESKLGIVDPSGKVLVQPAYRGAYKEEMLPHFFNDFKARGIPEAEVVTVLTREDGAAFAIMKNGALISLD